MGVAVTPAIGNVRRNRCPSGETSYGADEPAICSGTGREVCSVNVVC
jgi:hypothetical protein